MTAVQHAATHDEVDRNLAFLTYALLFFSVFFAGIPALIAVAIAYARRKDADPLVRGHHAFQIWIFWVGFFLALMAGAAGLTAITMGVGRAIQLASQDHWQGWRDLPLSDVVGPGVLTFGSMFFVFACCGGIWVVTASIYGFVRLASLRPMRQRPR